LSLAGPSVKFVENANDKDVERFLSGAQAFLFAAYEDFGVTPVEALAAGTPVIAFKDGGALDYVVEGQTGMFFADQTVDSLCKAILESEEVSFNHKAIQRHAATFSPATFRDRLSELVEKVT
jgi:glycosyltransferase involved in cell wall biosynthesis